MKLFTIGFTQKSAEEFFTALRDAGVKRIIDVRLNNISQLAGFAKQKDLAYFAKAICGIDYVHVPELAPTQEILDTFKKKKGDWQVYEKQFLALMRQRQVEKTVPKNLLDHGCLLCSEHEPKHCHRRLVAEYLQQTWQDLEIHHLA